MDKKKIKRLSNGIFAVAIGFAAVTLVIVAKDYLPAISQGACPFNRHRTLVYTAVALLLVSVVMTSILDTKVKKLAQADETMAAEKSAEPAEKPAAEENAEPAEKPAAEESEITAETPAAEK